MSRDEAARRAARRLALDAVVAAVLARDELAELMARIETTDGGGEVVHHSPTSANARCGGVLSAFNVRRHGDTVFLGANGLYLARGVIYVSADTLHTHPDQLPDIAVQACLKVQGRQVPHILLASLPGRHVSALVDHPALGDPRLIMGPASVDQVTVVKARGGPRHANGPQVGADPAAGAFTVSLPQLMATPSRTHRNFVPS